MVASQIEDSQLRKFESPFEGSTNPAIAALTGCRFVAAAAVLFVHSLNSAVREAAGYEQLATSAVGFFFVLSGFILAYVYSNRLDWSTVPSYLVARVARIWPLHAVCLLFGASLLLSRGELDPNLTNGLHLIASLLLIQSWIPVGDYAFFINSPAWSISTELGFYLAFPILLILGRRRFWPILLVSMSISAGTIIAMQVCYLSDPTNWALPSRITYVHPLARMLDFVLGMWLGRLHLTRSRQVPSKNSSIYTDSFLELLVIAMAFVAYWSASKTGWLHEYLIEKRLWIIDYWCFCGGVMLAPFCAIIWVLSKSNGLVAKFLSQPFMVWLGEVSFALYLVQVPVMLLLKKELIALQIPVVESMAITISLALAMAAILHTAVELPLRKSLRDAASQKWQLAWNSLRAIPTKLASSGVAVGACLVVLANALVLHNEHERSKARGKKVEVANRIQEFRKQSTVTFSGEGTLLSYEFEQDDRELRLLLLWETLPSRQRGRFLHFYDAKGEIVWRLPLELELFQKAQPGEIIEDLISVPNSRLPKNAFIGVGFYEKSVGASRIENARNVSGSRLEILEIVDGRAKRTR